MNRSDKKNMLYKELKARGCAVSFKTNLDEMESVALKNNVDLAELYDEPKDEIVDAEGIVQVVEEDMEVVALEDEDSDDDIEVLDAKVEIKKANVIPAKQKQVGGLYQVVKKSGTSVIYPNGKMIHFRCGDKERFDAKLVKIVVDPQPGIWKKLDE